MNTWQQWANGQPIAPDRIEHAARALHVDAGRNPQLRALRDTLPVQPTIARTELFPELSID
jgi:hypothetical protein